MGLHLPPFLQQMRFALAPVLDSPVALERGQIELDVARVPKIVLDYDPFESGEAERYSRPEKF
jgi:hypothetical protein